jgi:hypothetical protein
MGAPNLPALKDRWVDEGRQGGQSPLCAVASAKAHARRGAHGVRAPPHKTDAWPLRNHGLASSGATMESSRRGRRLGQAGAPVLPGSLADRGLGIGDVP